MVLLDAVETDFDVVDFDLLGPAVTIRIVGIMLLDFGVARPALTPDRAGSSGADFTRLIA